MLIEALIVNGHLGSSSDGRILECGSRSTAFTIKASIEIKVHHRLNYDYWILTRILQFSHQNLRQEKLTIYNQYLLNYEHGS